MTRRAQSSADAAQPRFKANVKSSTSRACGDGTADGGGVAGTGGRRWWLRWGGESVGRASSP
jgi:hypothetical protein